jgi:hypothetical protein
MTGISSQISHSLRPLKQKSIMPTKRSGRGPYPDLNQAYFRLPWNLGEDRVLYIRDCSFKILSLWNILVGGSVLADRLDIFLLICFHILKRCTSSGWRTSVQPAGICSTSNFSGSYPDWFTIFLMAESFLCDEHESSNSKFVAPQIGKKILCTLYFWLKINKNRHIT